MLLQTPVELTARDAPDVRTVLRRGGDQAEVRDVLRRLGPLDREVVVLRYRDRLSLDAIASLTESTVGAVHQRLRRGALAVEDAMGPSIDVTLTAADDRDEESAIEDLRLGITPQLAARLRRAVVTGDLSVLSRVTTHRRRLRVEAWLRHRVPPLATLVLVALGGLLTAVALGGTT